MRKFLRSLSLRVVIFVVFLISYISVVGVTVFLFNGIYYDVVVEKYIVENQKSITVANNIMNGSLNDFSFIADNIALQEDLRILYKTGDFVKLDPNLVSYVKTRKASSVDYMKIASDNIKKYRKSKKLNLDLEFYDINFKLIGGSSNIYKDLNNDEKQIYKTTFELSNYASSFGCFDRYKDDIILKGFSNIYVHGSLGYISVKTLLDTEFLSSIKAFTNKEIVFILDDKIKRTTMAGGLGVPVYNIDTSKYKMIEIENKKSVFNFIEIKNLKNDIVGYMGVGFDYSVIEQEYFKSITNIIIGTLLVSILLFIGIYFTLGMIFKPLNKITTSLDKIAGGKYDEVLELYISKEFNKFVTSINTLSGAVQEREKSLITANNEKTLANEQLITLNATLEEKVEERTSLLKKANEDLHLMQEKLVHTEKIATLGTISGGIAHTINSPLTGVLTTLQIMDSDIEKIADNEVKESITESVEIIKDGVKKSAAAIKELMTHVEKYKKEMNVSSDADYNIYNSENSIEGLVDYTLRKKEKK